MTSKNFTRPASRGQRFAMYRDETPAPRGAVQLPLDGDELRLSETTGRFAVYVDEYLHTRDVDLTSILRAMADFGIADPTIRQLRRSVSISYPGEVQIRLSQRPPKGPDDEPDVVIVAPIIRRDG